MSLNEHERQILQKAKIGLLGFGAQGEAEAMNLQRSQIPFLLGIREDGRSAQKARAACMTYTGFADVIAQSETLVMNLADHVHKEFYEAYIRPAQHIRRIVFAHGFSTHYGLIPIQESGPRHILVAPKGAASGLKEFYGTPSALPAILAVLPQSAANEEKAFAEAYAKAIGAHSKALIWARFKDETECDLFSEQALLCGGVSELLRQTYEVMVESGYHPETAYFESLFELKLIVDLIWREGITGMRSRISPTARYGDISRGDRIITADTKARMKEILAEVQSGAFAQEFLRERLSEKMRAKELKQSEHPLEVIGKKLREQLANKV